MSFESQFKNPGSEFRGKPFWSWNGRLEKKELLRQLDVFKEMGLGGAFMHSRVGLGTPYLSEEWFDLVDACAKKAEADGMEAWLYDEDRWPSGAAGGIVTKDERYRMRFLRIDVLEDAFSFKPGERFLAAFAAKLDGETASGVRRLPEGFAASALKKGERLLAFSEELHPCSSWYNGYTYLDTMNEEAVDKFIEVTHEAYLEHNGKRFGKAIPGIFTDEPHYGHGRFFDVKAGSGTSQWTSRLPVEFSKRYGYELLDHLPEIFFFVEGAKFSKARRDYRDCLTHLFVNAFGRKIYEFCEKAGIEFTGHVLEEPTLVSQTQAVGAAMRFYEYMQAPGIDILCGQGLKREGGAGMEISSAKQTESMRRQFGRKRMLSELYGCTGWNFTFAEHKAVGDWQAALGVNLRCQHLSWYTMEGEAKRDYPASISFQSAWHKEYRTVEDYFARVHAALAIGEATRDVAVLHPIESAWGSYIIRRGDGPWSGGSKANWIAEKLNDRLDGISKALLTAHCDFDFIDEDVIARHGSVEGSALKVKLASYKAVVVPPILCVRESTAKLLAAFVKAGGAVFIVANDAELAAFEQGGALDTLKGFAKKSSLAALPKALAKAGAARVSVKSLADGKEYSECLYMLRRDAASGRSVLFVTHNLQDRSSGPVEISLPASGKLFELDAASGRILSVPEAKAKDGLLRFESSLEPCGSRLFIVEEKPSLKADAPRKALKKLSSAKLKLDAAGYSLSEPNAISLDLAECKIGRHWNGPFEVLKLDRVVRDALGLPYRSGDMVQPWARTPVAGAKEGRPIELAFAFKADEIPEGQAWLVLERPSEFQCKLNGEPLALKEDGWWLDNSFKKVAIPAGRIVKGWNKIWLSANYTADSGIEAIYLLGRFSASRDCEGRAVLGRLPKAVGIGDWAEYGLESFTGALSYSFEIEAPRRKGARCFLKLGRWEGVVAKILVDGEAAGAAAWPPCEVDVTDALAGKAKAKLEIKLYAGRRNLLGPLHLSERWPRWTGPGEFVPGLERWSPLPVNFAAGLLEAPSLVVKA